MVNTGGYACLHIGIEVLNKPVEDKICGRLLHVESQPP